LIANPLKQRRASTQQAVSFPAGPGTLLKFSLQGKVAVVTGASSGIGLSIATALHAAGAKVVLLARRADLLDAEVAKLGGLAGGAACVAADLNERFREAGADGDMAALAREVSMPFRQVPDIVVNSAGVNLRQPWSEVTRGTWNDTLDLNLAVPFFFTRAVLDLRTSAGKAASYGLSEAGHVLRPDELGFLMSNTSQYGLRVINIASLQSSLAMPNSVPYGASKGGVAQLTRAMAEAWSGPELRVGANAIAPGFFRTELTGPVFADPARVAALSSKTAVGRTGDVEDLQGTAVFLASAASAYVTGQVIYVDGGHSAKG
jgi:NAD(P)-dependent dehydrogenase (short-subunit alcohol dehydrogenase family)